PPLASVNPMHDPSHPGPACALRTARSVVGLVLAVALAAPPGRSAPPTDAEMTGPFPHPKGYVCHRAAAPPLIDGALTDEAWADAPWTDPFVDIEGDRKPAPRYRTRVKMIWDDEALYIGAELEEPHVWATLTDHDAVIFHDPDFEVFLDPDGDNHLYAELELNALNTTWDLLLTKPYKDGGKAINAWEITGLKSAVRIDGTLNDPQDNDRGWTVEIRWPWTGLKELSGGAVPPKDQDRWRVNFSRVEWDTRVVGGKYEKVKGRPEHNWVWSPQGVIDMHRPERWGYVQFSTAQPGKAAFRPDPDWPTRDLLHRVYYAQRVYRKANGRYARAVGDLGLKDVSTPVDIETTRGGFEASVTTGGPGLAPRRWVITHDAHVRAEPVAADGRPE
ncbi:MAG TPA: carbohydrate-binding family 9-like protein, partial [Gemmataceae bacterium]|nr:carbohydrate-binding family 9-like protein [Gemmataceae bacterium]